MKIKPQVEYSSMKQLKVALGLMSVCVGGFDYLIVCMKWSGPTTIGTLVIVFAELWRLLQKIKTEDHPKNTQGGHAESSDVKKCEYK